MKDKYAQGSGREVIRINLNKSDEQDPQARLSKIRS